MGNFAIMERLIFSVVCGVLLSCTCMRAQSTDQGSAWDSLLGGIWYVSSQWSDGTPWYHTVRHERHSDGAIRTVSTSYADSMFTHVRHSISGLREMSSVSKGVFEERMADSLVSQGAVEIIDGDIYYIYDYSGQQMTDHWHQIDMDRYAYRVGVRSAGEWQMIYLDGVYERRADGEVGARLPYESIPAAPESYTASAVAARMVDGLGFRYYWATYDLRQDDLAYRASASSRKVEETLSHIMGLAEVIYNTVHAQPTDRTAGLPTMSYEEMRAQTLRYLWDASQTLRGQEDSALQQETIIFQRGNRIGDPYGFWYLLNGPLADALWHTGQVVAHRRASGNPLPVGVNVFTGTKQ